MLNITIHESFTSAKNEVQKSGKLANIMRSRSLFLVHYGLKKDLPRDLTPLAIITLQGLRYGTSIKELSIINDVKESTIFGNHAPLLIKYGLIKLKDIKNIDPKVYKALDIYFEQIKPEAIFSVKLSALMQHLKKASLIASYDDIKLICADIYHTKKNEFLL
jgi:hypothetical protein